MAWGQRYNIYILVRPNEQSVQKVLDKYEPEIESIGEIIEKEPIQVKPIAYRAKGEDRAAYLVYDAILHENPMELSCALNMDQDVLRYALIPNDEKEEVC